jgi:hypothetical protein
MDGRYVAGGQEVRSEAVHGRTVRKGVPDLSQVPAIHAGNVARGQEV